MRISLVFVLKIDKLYTFSCFSLLTHSINIKIKTMKAAVVPESVVETKLAEVKEIPKPTIGDDQILIKAEAAAVNPTDWKHIVFQMSKPGDVIGSDVSGTVEEVGSKVTNFKKVILSVLSLLGIYHLIVGLLVNMLLHILKPLSNTTIV